MTRSGFTGDRAKPGQNKLSIHCMLVRQLVGATGALLPIVLIVGHTISSATPRPDSMSGYYHTDRRKIFVGSIFVGSLCALGVFLVYDYDNVDLWVINIAGLGAIGVACCPTKPAVCVPGKIACPASSVARLSASQQAVGDIHLFLPPSCSSRWALWFCVLPTAGKRQPLRQCHSAEVDHLLTCADVRGQRMIQRSPASVIRPDRQLTDPVVWRTLVP